MSFSIVCEKCGASSSPSVGICPFCKAVLSYDDNVKDNSSLKAIELAYQKEELNRALYLAESLQSVKPEIMENIEFLFLYSKILLDSEGPSSKIKSLLTRAHLIDPSHQGILETMEIIEAKNELSKRDPIAGIEGLKKVLRRSPHNSTALFILGAHLFWVKGNLKEAITYLSASIRYRPNYIRALGCLGALYKKIGNETLAFSIFTKCAKLETDPAMKKVFLNYADEIHKSDTLALRNDHFDNAA